MKSAAYSYHRPKRFRSNQTYRIRKGDIYIQLGRWKAGMRRHAYMIRGAIGRSQEIGAKEKASMQGEEVFGVKVSSYSPAQRYMVCLVLSVDADQSGHIFQVVSTHSTLQLASEAADRLARRMSS